uniref:GPI alpha-1,4-mannosyltransferase I, catalytic subunit n=1 Tax=Panagrellus redivivus TaxID=6233 RepID=A0A7E4UYU8_PANRE
MQLPAALLHPNMAKPAPLPSLTAPDKLKQRADEFKVLTAAFSLRLAFVFYAQIHDYYFHVNFTDIDYKVFSDAAIHVANGRSPYDRPTYRYSPFLAWILVPIAKFPDFGKILFCFADIIVGWLLIRLRRDQNAKFGVPAELDSVSDVYALWLFNPLTMIISARGNADALVSLAVLCTLYLLRKDRWIAAALMHGLGAVHLRVYPVIYLPSIFLYLLNRNGTSGSGGFFNWVKRCCLNFRGFAFAIISLSSFAATVAICYWLYGYKCIFEFLLYHFSRYDIRHNFSPYFYPMYLSVGDEGLLKLISLGAFVPQALAIVGFALKYSNDLEFCWFLTTFAFVSLNKVCTSQYFVWYIIFTPLIANQIKTSTPKLITLILAWFAGQGLWLFFAYLLELQGMNTFLPLWLSSLVFVAINFSIAITLIRDHLSPTSITSKKTQ